ncbi:hypothetical protein [Bradyrhizobium sp. WSM1253]|uniref:hypothetical protein n=1 Tax=Bradyrhizobium sp. WSM1253 TaxID=319003 RepID=UPI00025D1219|nr:hypothetical protein [Bradyrhizobium sp. WSM1253]EIG63583.1 hypothetical protein Bra1253DRAFT_00074 [Bradyrhizobium sp. WSM1253]
MATSEQREELYRKIQQAVDHIVLTVVQKHYEALTQEPQLTAKVAEAIELALDNTDVGDLNATILVRDFPSQGRGALEGKVGADVYISTAVIDESGEDVSKGMLAQEKWDYTMDDPKLREQIEKMLDRTDSSYVWSYGPNGASCLPAKLHDPATSSGVQITGSLIANSLRCLEGDEELGRDLTKPTITSMNEIMEELGVYTGLSFTVREGKRRLRFYRRKRRER